MTQIAQSIAEKKLADMGMSDLPVMSFRPVRAAVSPDWFTQYRSAARRFLMSLTDSAQELVFMNLSRDAFMDLVMGRRIPDNLSVRMRVPIVWGGAISPENMFLCQTFPISQNLDRFIIEQRECDTIWLPNPAKKVYLPTHSGGGGAGGNATEDRLTQVAAQIAADRAME